MTTIIDLLAFEEGFRDRPYLDTEGYPTVGIGFLLARTKCTPAELKKYYDFTLPREAADSWLWCHLDGLVKDMAHHAGIGPAYAATADCYARRCVLISMAYQMGIEGLARFRNTLWHVAAGRYERAAQGMMNSRWANQTPDRARRHAEQMSTGKWAKEYSK